MTVVIIYHGEQDGIMRRFERLQSKDNTVTEAAEAVGVSATLLHKWKAKLEARLESEELSDEEYEELKQLRKEVKQLRMEKEILKKASAFFAKEMK